MYLTNVGATDNVAHVVLANPAASHDHEPSIALLDEPSEVLSALECGRCATRREDSIHAEVDELLERTWCIGRKIECPVKSQRQRASGFNQSPHLVDFDMTVGSKRSGYNSKGTGTVRCVDVPAHCVNLPRRVDEITGSRSDQDEDRSVDAPDDILEQLDPWCRAALVQSNAKLDSVGARALGGLRGLDCLYCRLDERQRLRGIAGITPLKSSALPPLGAPLLSGVAPFG